ncbi:hypothetical protein QBC41DRAFT_356880 [Cercophora samala]|uniref:FAD-binding domain-containing protein n=1 Tax=Cercophora samala TaxID=330535 RepID=A0AA39ZBR5_9PEZI|nr:hypothetical protein QBC41DRAFT_356880 [Cercophora samala]
MTDSKPILIAGAGIASLLLAQSLRLSKIPYKVFERDASFVFRAQGYRLRLSSEGLDAIQAVLDPETWQRFWDACPKTGGLGFASFNAVTGEQTEHHLVPPTLVSRQGGTKTIGISRGDMRRIFAQGCEGNIEWGKHVTGYELTGDGVRAIFADGTRSIEGSLLVGGEGIYSKVAKQLSQGKLKGVFRLRDDTRPDGAVFIITNVRPGEMDDPNVSFGWTMGGHPGVIRAPNDDYTIVGRTAANLAKSLTQNWHPRFRPLFEDMNESEAAFWKISCSTPSGVPEWPNQPRVTVIGDSVHSMTPAGGIGANTAVRDSALLGRLLGEAGGYKAGVTELYEREMRIYASEAVRESYSTAIKQFGILIDEETSLKV